MHKNLSTLRGVIGLRLFCQEVDPALAIDTYQQKDASGVVLIAGDENEGMIPIKQSKSD